MSDRIRSDRIFEIHWETLEEKRATTEQRQLHFMPKRTLAGKVVPMRLFIYEQRSTLRSQHAHTYSNYFALSLCFLHAAWNRPLLPSPSHAHASASQASLQKRILLCLTKITADRAKRHYNSYFCSLHNFRFLSSERWYNLRELF